MKSNKIRKSEFSLGSLLFFCFFLILFYRFLSNLAEPIPKNDSRNSYNQNYIQVLSLRGQVFHRNEKDLNALIPFFLNLLSLLFFLSYLHFCIKILNKLGDGLLVRSQLWVITAEFIEIVAIKDVKHAGWVKLIIIRGVKL